MLFVIVLVVFFCPVKFRCRHNHGHNFTKPEYTGSLHSLFGFSCYFSLFWVVVKDHGAVICANIRALAVQLCRVMDRPENSKKLARN